MQQVTKIVELRKVVRPKFDEKGLVAVIAQDAATKEVLMFAYTDEAGYLETLKTGRGVYWSRSRKRRWLKGEESGHFQNIQAVYIDCDSDAVIYRIEQIGPGACHTEARSCFYRSAIDGSLLMPAPKAGKKDALEFMDAEVSVELLDSSSQLTLL